MSRVLVLSPHPDDESLGCGGTLRKHVDEGDSVSVVFMTSGEQGGQGRPADVMRRVREGEAMRAARILGIEQIEFWREPDGALRATSAVVDRLRRKINSLRPHLIYLPHEREAHPDHRAVARALRAAMRNGKAGVHRPAVRMFEVWTPIERMDVIVDITSYIEVKLKAIRKYRSQCEVMRFDDAARGLARYRGEMFSWPEGEYAEVFALLEERP